MVTTHTFAGHTYLNGYVPAAVLAELDGPYAGYADRPRLRRDAAASWNRARAEVLRETGVDLVVRGWNRTYATQVQFYLERHRKAAPGERICCYWNGTPYVFTGVGHAAPPGTSNHGWGLAVDVTDFGGVGDWTNPRRRAAMPILARHGWTDTEGRGSIQEPWHLVYDPARDTHPPTQEDDMTPQESAKLDRALALLEKFDDQGVTETWLHKRIGGTNRRRADGSRVDPTISEDLSVIRQRLTALAAANRTLAESMGADPAAIEAAVERAVRDALADGVTLTSKEN